MFRTRSLKEIGGYSTEFKAQDGWEVWLKLKDRMKFSKIQTSVFYYRQLQNSVSKKPKLLQERSKIIKKISKKTFELPARVSLEEFEKEIGVKLKIEKKDEIDTIGGFIFFLIGRIPGRGEVINYKKILEFTVIEADTRRIKKILVTLKK